VIFKVELIRHMNNSDKIVTVSEEIESCDWEDAVQTMIGRWNENPRYYRKHGKDKAYVSALNTIRASEVDEYRDVRYDPIELMQEQYAEAGTVTCSCPACDKELIVEPFKETKCFCHCGAKIKTRRLPELLY